MQYKLFFYDNNYMTFRYGVLLADFSYFTSVESFNAKLEANGELQDRDEQFRENHLSLLKRFYKVFESVYKYIIDINRLLLDYF